MNKIDFSTLLFRFAQMSGLDRDSLTLNNFKMFRDFVNGRYELVRNSDYWPPLIRITPYSGRYVTTTTFLDTTVSGSTYDAINGVYKVTGYDDSGYPFYTINGNESGPCIYRGAYTWNLSINGRTPAATVYYSTSNLVEGTNSWGIVSGPSPVPSIVTTSVSGPRTFALDGDIGDVLQVYDKDPRTTTRARNVKYYLYEDGTDQFINVMEDVDPIYIEYKLEKPDLFGNPFTSGSTYYAGAQVYFETSTNSGSLLPDPTRPQSGNFYNCLVNGTTLSPTDSPNSWELVEIPFFVGEYLIRGSHSDYLRSESQFDQATQVEMEAEAVRQAEVEKVLREKGQVRRINMQTY